MERLLYVIIAILIATWIIGFFLYSLGALIHLLLLLALIILVIRLARRRRPRNYRGNTTTYKR